MTHDEFRKQAEDSYLENVWDQAEIDADPEGARLSAEMWAEGYMGSLHAGDVCPVCDPDRSWED